MTFILPVGTPCLATICETFVLRVVWNGNRPVNPLGGVPSAIAYRRTSTHSMNLSSCLPTLPVHVVGYNANRGRQEPLRRSRLLRPLGYPLLGSGGAEYSAPLIPMGGLGCIFTILLLITFIF